MVVVGRWVVIGVNDTKGGNVAAPRVQNNGQNYLIINHSSHPLIPRNEGNERQHLI